MRPKTIPDDLLPEIKTKIADGTFTKQEVAAHYGIPYPTLCRNLNKAFGKIEVRPDTGAANILVGYLRENNLSTDGTSHQRMLVMDTLADRFDRKLLCKVFDINPDSFSKHRRNLAHGPNSHKRREAEIEKAITSILGAFRAFNPQATISPTQLCRALAGMNIVTSPQLVSRILKRVV